MPKDRHSKKKRRRSTDGRASATELLILAGLGDHRGCRKLLRKGVPVNAKDYAGSTALHEACRQGHLKTVELLLRYGADPSSRDTWGNTPAHLAAAAGHLATLAALLGSRRPPDLETRNGEGVSISDATQAAMARQDRAADASPDRGEDSPEEDWGTRMAAEMSGDEEDPFGGEWGAPAPAPESVDEFAQRIWQEMQDRLHARHAATESEFLGARKRQRAEAAAAAASTSHRILEEERAKDAAWREAVAQGDAGARRAAYEARWQMFLAQAEGEVGIKDVPWILGQVESQDPEQLRLVILHGAEDHAARRRRLRAELGRWHPDKFIARFGRRLAAQDAAAITAAVVALSQHLNALAAALPRA